MFRCRFVGPHPIQDVLMAAPVLHERYFMAPNPQPDFAGGTMPWIAVGFEPGHHPDPEWPGQVTYELDPDVSTIQFHGEQPVAGVAIFRYKDPAP